VYYREEDLDVFPNIIGYVDVLSSKQVYDPKLTSFSLLVCIV